VTVDGESVEVRPGATVLDACTARGVDTPTLCFGDTIRARNVCRVCVVEVAGNRALVPACSRPVEAGMEILTDSPRVRHARRLVLELLGSSVDLSLTGGVDEWSAEYGADPARFGTEAQNTFAIWVSGRGFGARIATEYDAVLPDSACVYCGNCIEVCPTGALMFKSEFDLRESGGWAEERQHTTTTICPYCRVGCNLDLVVQDNQVVRVNSPADHEITHGNLCIKGRFGTQEPITPRRFHPPS